MKKIGLVLGLALAGVCAALAGETFVRAVSTGAYGEWTHTGGGVLKLLAVQSGATGGVLRVKHDLMVGSAGAATRDIGNLTTVETSRVVGALPTDVYVLTGQKITLTNTTAVASHTVFLVLEKLDQD